MSRDTKLTTNHTFGNNARDLIAVVESHYVA